jgi:hypothetical protein
MLDCFLLKGIDFGESFMWSSAIFADGLSVVIAECCITVRACLFSISPFFIYFWHVCILDVLHILLVQILVIIDIIESEKD